MKEENKQILINRFKSLCWRTASMVIVIALSFIADNINLFDIPAELQVFIGLIIGEITKALNKQS